MLPMLHRCYTPQTTYASPPKADRLGNALVLWRIHFSGLWSVTLLTLVTLEDSLQWLPQNSHKDRKHLAALAPNLSPEFATEGFGFSGDNLSPLLAPKLSNSASLVLRICIHFNYQSAEFGCKSYNLSELSYVQMYLMFGKSTQTVRERRFAIEIKPFKLTKWKNNNK